MNIYLEKFKRCRFCNRSHKIVEEGTLPKLKKRKLKKINCHLRHAFYVGSFVENKIVHDVFNASRELVKRGIISERETVYVITVGEKGEKFIEENSLEEMIETESWEAIYQYEDEEEEGLY